MSTLINFVSSFPYPWHSLLSSLCCHDCPNCWAFAGPRFYCIVFNRLFPILVGPIVEPTTNRLQTCSKSMHSGHRAFGPMSGLFLYQSSRLPCFPSISWFKSYKASDTYVIFFFLAARHSSNVRLVSVHLRSNLVYFPDLLSSTQYVLEITESILAIN